MSVTDSRVPVLWITGPSGVGKSTVSWQIFTELAQAGIRVAFADTDQFCMCFPPPTGDPNRERIKAQNVGALVPRYRVAGARCVIANGCVDPLRGVYTELMPRAEVTVCRLRADREEVARRFSARDGASDEADGLLREALEEADAMDASSFADACIDTTGRAASEVAELVRDRCRDWPGFSGSLREARSSPGDEASGASDLDANGGAGDPDDAPGGGDLDANCGGRDPDGEILLICGPTGVGKSTVGFQLFIRYVRDGRPTGYVDLDQIGFLRPGSANDPGRHRLKAGNLAAMWRTYHAAGARHLIAVGPIESDAVLPTYARALPTASVTVCRLHADPTELTRRVMSRGEGGSWPQPGDPLRGQPAEYLSQMADQAAADAEALERAGVGSFRIDTSGRTVAETVDSIAALT